MSVTVTSFIYSIWQHLTSCLCVLGVNLRPLEIDINSLIFTTPMWSRYMTALRHSRVMKCTPVGRGQSWSLNTGTPHSADFQDKTPNNGHLGGFHILAIVNSAAMNTGLHVSFWIMVFFGYMPSCGIAGSYGSSIFSFLKKPPYCYP